MSVIFALLLALAGQAAERVALARGGTALVPVVVSVDASEATRAIAAELAAYLQRITGATFTVKSGNGATGIVLGTLAQFPDPALAKALEIRDTYDGREAFAIRCSAGRVRLIGATETGVSHAAFRLLEEIGCRWYFPAKEWEVVPSIRDLAVSLEISDRPAMLSRPIWYAYGLFVDKEKRPQTEDLAWKRHNLVAASHTVHVSHAWQAIIAGNKAVIAEHPEYLALVDGKRQGDQLCVSNPAVRRMMIEWALAQCRAYPERDMVSLETSDNTRHCTCADCVKLGSISDRAYGIANEAARAVAQAFPGKMLGMLAYSDHSEPPSFVLEPNIYVELTAGFNRGRYTFDELIELWPKKARRFGVYLYMSNWMGDHDTLPGMNGANIGYLRRIIPEAARNGAVSIDCQAGNNWGAYGRGYYIANKLMWNPRADVDALLADFYQQAFGPAAKVMQRYYERVDPGNRPLMSEHLLGLALRDLKEASTLAADRPDVLARLTQLKQYLHYVRLRWEFDHASDVETKLAWGVKGLTQAYRTRYAYMNHWNTVRAWSREMSRQYNKPEWSDAKAPKPWEVPTEVTLEETETAFREDLERFKPVTLETATFSTELAPAGFTTAAPAGFAIAFLGSGRLALYSRQGEPLELTVAAGTLDLRRNRPQARYSVKNSAGKEVATGTLPLDGKEQAVKIAVPAAGSYLVAINDFGSGWRLTTAPDRSAVLAPAQEYSPTQNGLATMYFYVPKGTQRLQYFWSGQAHDIRTPDGKIAMKVDTRDTYITCPVPAGADGKVWSFTRFRPGEIQFQNAPNYLAPSPDALLIPIDVAKRDGLLKP